MGFYCEDSKLWATYIDRDDPLYREDVVEVYIDPDGNGETYLEVEVSPVNTIFDLWLTKPWDSGGQGFFDWTMEGLETESSHVGTLNSNSDQDSSWICEMALPFEAMAFSADSMNFPPLENEMWRFNMYRFDRASNNDPNGEATGWSQTEGGQHEPDKFGKIIFAGLTSDIVQSYEGNNIIKDFKLCQNYPNPFNLSTTIQFQILSNNYLSLIVYDIQGKEVAVLIDEYKSAGNYTIRFKANNLPGGIYLYKISVGSYSEIKKMTLIR